MVKPEYQVIRFESSVVTGDYTDSGRWCETYCKYQCGSQDPGCQGVCVGEIDPCNLDYECPPD